MRESEIEKIFVWNVVQMGGQAFKFKSVNCRGVSDQVVMLPEGRLAPGQARSFNAIFFDPPSEAANIQVEFALDVAPIPPQPTKLAEVPKLRGPVQPSLPPAPAPKDATPLPAGSPYALPATGEDSTHRAHEG